MTRREELEGLAVQTVSGMGPVKSNDRTVLDRYKLYDAITNALLQVEREVWERVIEKAEQAERDTADPQWILDWCRAQQKELT